MGQIVKEQVLEGAKASVAKMVQAIVEGVQEAEKLQDIIDEGVDEAMEIVKENLESEDKVVSDQVLEDIKEIAKEQVSEQLEAIIEEAELPEVVTEQQARVPKTLEDSDPGFVEAREESSLAEPNIPVPRAASRQHYYQHQ